MRTPLHDAAQHGNLKEVKSLLDAKKISIDCQDKFWRYSFTSSYYHSL
ncbi:ankyrin repeat domain-containing protein [Orientia tsutsugamushi]